MNNPRLCWPRLAASAGAAACALLLLVACPSTAPTAEQPRDDPQAGAHPGAPNVAVAAHDDHDPGHAPARDDHGEEHDHAEAASDLDRGVDELFAARCEHAVETYTCDECRYEVGVVRLPRSLVDQGLVREAVVRRRDLDGELQLTGEIQFDARRIVHLSPRVPGVVQRVAVDLGDSVAPGALLVELESVELAEAQASYLEARVAAQLAQRTFERQRELRQAGIASEREFLEAEQQQQTAALRVDSARHRLQRLGMADSDVQTLEQQGLRAAAGRLSVRSSIAGTVMELHAVRGERIEPGAEMVLVGDTGTLWLWVDLYEQQLAPVSAALRQGPLVASAGVQAYPGEQFEGRVDFVGRVMDEHTRTVKARISLDNPAGKLRPGMFARVRLPLASDAGTAVVPSAALLEDEGRDFVFVHHRDEYYVRRPVQRGREIAGEVEILDGLQPGQTVVADGSFLLKSDVLRAKMGEGCAH